MSFCLFISLSDCLSDFLFVYLPVCLSVSLSDCLSVWLCLFICLSVYLSFYLFICRSVCLSDCLSVRLIVCLSMSPSACLWKYQCGCKRSSTRIVACEESSNHCLQELNRIKREHKTKGDNSSISKSKNQNLAEMSADWRWIIEIVKLLNDGC